MNAFEKFLALLCRLLHLGCGKKPPVVPPPAPTNYHVQVFPPEVQDFKGRVVVDDKTEIVGVKIDRMLKFVINPAQKGSGATLFVDAPGYNTFVQRFVVEGPDSHLVDMNIQMVGALVPLAKVSVDGRNLSHVLRDVTAFRLLEHVAHGREAKAVAYLDKIRELGFNSARVLTTLSGWFNLTSAEAKASIDRLAYLMHQRGIYLNPVALAGTNVSGMGRDEMLDYMRWLGNYARSTIVVGVTEVANENSHESQSRELRDARFTRQLVEAFGPGAPVSSGSNCCGESDEEPPEQTNQGNVVTVHVDRSRDTWNRTRHVREMELASSKYNKWFWSNEPIGFAEEGSGSRSTDVGEAFAQGVLSRVMGIGATFHMGSGLECDLPGPVQEAAARAFIRGVTIVPDNVRLTFKNTGWADSPVKAFGEGLAVRVYTGVQDNAGIMVALGLNYDSNGVNADAKLALAEGWRIEALLAEYPGVAAYKIVRV